MSGVRRYVWLTAALLATTAAAQDELELLPVQGKVWMIAGPGGNTTVQIGHEAVIVVDTQTAAVSDELIGLIDSLSPQPIRHVIVTSADADHTGGNAPVSAAGTYVRLIDSFDPRGSDASAAIMAHVDVLARMSAPTGEEAAAPVEAWPTDTYFTHEWDLFVNDEAIRLLHVPAAHTDGDTMVFFRRSDVISAGDIFNTDRYPPFDPGRGGSISGVLDGLNLLLELAVAGENQTGGTVIVPGHGRLADETDVANYRDMATIVRDRIQAMIAAGLTLDDVLASRPTRDYDGIYTHAGKGRSGDEFAEAVYLSLQAEQP